MMPLLRGGLLAWKSGNDAASTGRLSAWKSGKDAASTGGLSVGKAARMPLLRAGFQPGGALDVAVFYETNEFDTPGSAADAFRGGAASVGIAHGLDWLVPAGGL